MERPLCVPLMVVLMLCFWRLESALAAIRAHDDEGAQRWELLQQSCAALAEIPLTLMRVACYILVCGIALVLLITWRAPSLLAKLRAIEPEHRTADRLSRDVLLEALKLIVDLPAMVAALIVAATSVLVGAIGRALCLPRRCPAVPWRLRRGHQSDRPFMSIISSSLPGTPSRASVNLRIASPEIRGLPGLDERPFVPKPS